MKYVFFLISLGVFSFALSAAPIDTHTFEDKEKQTRYLSLIQEMRCPVCQNQNLADSNSPISHDLRSQIYNQLKADKTDQEIVDYMTYRYGEYILYDPKLSSKTYFLWFGPAILLIFGLGTLIFVVSRNKRTIKKQALSDQQQAELDSLFKDSSNK